MKKIVCYGDSITFGYHVGNGEQVENNYPKVLQEKLGSEYIVINEGHSGWRSINGQESFDELVLAKKPDIVIMMFGINDAKGSSYGITLKYSTYWEAMLEMYNKCLEHNITPIFFTPTPTKNKRADKFAKRLRKRSEKLELNFCDMNTHVLTSMIKNHLTMKSALPDGIHFADEYYELVGIAAYEHLINNVL